MKQAISVTDTVFENAKALGMYDVPNVDLTVEEARVLETFEPQDGMCAGHESR